MGTFIIKRGGVWQNNKLHEAPAHIELDPVKDAELISDKASVISIEEHQAELEAQKEAAELQLKRVKALADAEAAHLAEKKKAKDDAEKKAKGGGK